MKKKFIITLLLSAAVLTGCGAKEEVETKEFDFTLTEFVDAFSEDYGIDLTSVMVIDAEEDGSKIASYSFSTANDNGKNMHYSVCYDETTDNVTQISFFFDKNFMGDIKKALTRYYYHIDAIAEIIDPDIDIDKIYNVISSIKGIQEGKDGTAIYNGEKFLLVTSCNDMFYDAMFSPTTNTKGD